MRNAIALSVGLFIGPFAVLAQLPAGSVAQFPFNNSAADISGNGFNGTLVSTADDVNRFGTASSATAFIAGTSTGTLPSGLVTALADDFTVGYWVKTTMSAASSTQWYGGAALVDAEVCGGTSDWGTALINGGHIAFGIGNPDITIISPLSYNDGSWHFVTATRAEAAGVITLYVDGSQVATTSGASTAARTAPPLIGLGRNPCVATGVFTGSLDDAIAYSSALTPTQVSDLYTYFSGVALPIHWGSFTGQVEAGLVYLKWTTENSSDDGRFEIQRSAPGGAFSPIGEVVAGEGTPGAGSNATYGFVDIHPAAGDNYYRIEGTDNEGSRSWTSILKLTVAGRSAGIHLGQNPVADELTLINDGGLPIHRLQVLDMAGRVLIDQAPASGNSPVGLRTSGLRAGYYFLRIGESGNWVTIAFVKL
ncbi:MAG TPA: LamG-like jellyroll fold domain-containing protein [Puia sp.]|uniref:LamG-like jellyroll fold domain-containing protein n=1 Tax=Puia sp. TaxID=2045100 RepID=UPI002C7ACE73|nr:LamG-like jellyroll fold domain-containing protein [Puia sp.]HVU98885.1 LamG-like jellyroll fold domain-containing protein [Puia sp.]